MFSIKIADQRSLIANNPKILLIATCNDNSFLVAPGKVTMVEITAEKLSASDGYRELSVEDRGCYFEDEMRLQLFSEYTSDNCWIECLLNLTRKVPS